MDDWRDFLLSAWGYLLVGAAGVVLAVVVSLFAPYFWRRLLPLPRLRPGRWTGREVVLAFLSMYVVQMAMIVVLATAIEVYMLATAPDGMRDIFPAVPEQKVGRLVVIGSPVTVALTLAVVVGSLRLMSRTRPHQYGLTSARWPANVILGVLTYVVLTPLTLGLYLLLTLIVGAAPHPFEDLVMNGFAPWEWVLLVFMTVVGAPLIEETVFRGVLQSWLPRAGPFGHRALCSMVLAVGAMPLLAWLLPAGDSSEGNAVKVVASLLFSVVLVGGYAIWMRRLPTLLFAHCSETDLGQPALCEAAVVSGDEHAILTGMPEPPLPGISDIALPRHALDFARARLSIYGSAMLFGVVHGWPQSVPLFVLGLGLGWLAYRTQSLIGCMVCHGLFNAVACCVLWWNS